MESFFLDEDVEVGEGCCPGKERRRDDLRGTCTTGQSHLMLLGIGYPFADHTPVTALGPPWRFLVVQRHKWGCYCLQQVLGMGRLCLGKHKELPAPAEHCSLQHSQDAR